MYPQCRHVRTDSDRCRAAAIKGGHWCYYHSRLHQQQEVARRRFEAGRQPRLSNGLFAPREATVDQGYPAGGDMEPVDSSAAEESAPRSESQRSIVLQLPAPEDSASIQLALIEVIQALAADQIKPRRAGLLLYGLQVASANAKNVHVHANSIRAISFTKEGIPLATQEHGWDVEDIEEADRQAEEEEDEDE
ncbi:MAG TPA: hypothetical protein VF126_02395 [Acidobacteriaceae bacterium]